MKPTQKQIKEVWKWCGFQRRKLGWWYPSGLASVLDLPPIDLNNLFKYAAPKLRKNNEYPYLTEIILDPTVCDTEIYYCYLRYNSLHDDGFVEREESQSSDSDPALALFWAIYKVMK